MKRSRVFIAINLPNKIKERLAEYQENWPDLPCRWTKKESLHITVSFLGYLSDEELVEACQSTKELIQEKKSFEVKLNKVCYGPLDKKHPRMVWAVGEKIKEFNFLPHITLGRIQQWAFKQINPEERPEINQDIDLSFKVNSVEIMESHLKRGGPEYIILESCLLKE